MTPQESKQFKLFKEEVLKYDKINNDELLILISRYTSRYMGRKFFNNKLKLKYYSFWIKILHKAGDLKETPHFGLWEINRNTYY
jgi:hypothetical protein